MSNLEEIIDRIRNVYNHYIENIKDNLENCMTDLCKVLNTYRGNDWKEYKSSCVKNYERVLIPMTTSDDIFELILISWSSKAESPIHNHSENGCVFKLLEGSLIEKVYHKDKINGEVQINFINEGCVSYMYDSIGVHKIISNNDKPSYSLHIYSPSGFAAEYF